MFYRQSKITRTFWAQHQLMHMKFDIEITLGLLHIALVFQLHVNLILKLDL